MRVPKCGKSLLEGWTLQVDEGKIQELALKELKLYIDLNSLLDEEERCVDLSDVEGLMDVLRRKQRLISEQEMLQGLWAEVASAMGIEDGRESISFWNALAQRLGEEGYRQIVEKVEEIRNLVSRLLEREREIQLRLEGQVGELRQKLLTLQKGRQAFRGYIKHDGASG